MYGEGEFVEIPVAGLPEEIPTDHDGNRNVVAYANDVICDLEGIDGGVGGDQLTLSYCGQVFVFDNVTSDKVQKVFFHLGGCEYPATQQGSESAYQNQRDFDHTALFVVQDFDYTARCSDPRRAASLNRFRQKRKERCFEKKIRYNVRQDVAKRFCLFGTLSSQVRVSLQTIGSQFINKFDTVVKGSILTPCKAGGPFLPLVEPEAASLPLVGVGLSTSQPPSYTVEDGGAGLAVKALRIQQETDEGTIFIHAQSPQDSSLMDTMSKAGAPEGDTVAGL
ncbi:GATA transcription factor [Tanacetum coccineum]|uniref:GATA transcription factor n=1 Tax=Tanacetum coccineum TaxID=301880 RepID=A0ABQ5GSB4_9ASTR